MGSLQTCAECGEVLNGPGDNITEEAEDNATSGLAINLNIEVALLRHLSLGLHLSLP